MFWLMQIHPEKDKKIKGAGKIQENRFYSKMWKMRVDRINLGIKMKSNNENLSPKDVGRYIQTASVLEPISEKEGCTGRKKNIDDCIKLEYFLVAGINIGHSFEMLADRIINNNFTLLYDLAYDAQLKSFNNRGGGRINQGIIELIFPLVISQLSYNNITVCEQIENTKNILIKKTNKEDVIWLQRMQNLAFASCGYKNRLFLIEEQENIYKYYTERFNLFNKKSSPSDYFHNREIVEKYPTLKSMFTNYASIRKGTILEKMEIVFYKEKMKNDKIPSGILADLICCLLYLIISNKIEKV